MKTKIIFIIGFLILIFGVLSFSSESNVRTGPVKTPSSSRIETFTFSSNWTAIKGKIFLPASYETNKNLPAIYLIDFTEQHFKLAIDEFEKAIKKLKKKDANNNWYLNSPGADLADNSQIWNNHSINPTL